MSQVITAQLAHYTIVNLSVQAALTPQVHLFRRVASAQPARRVHTAHQGPTGPKSAQLAITAQPAQSATQTSHARQARTERQRITLVLLVSRRHRNALLALLVTSARAGLSLLNVAQSAVTCLLPPLRWRTKVTQQLWGNYQFLQTDPGGPIALGVENLSLYSKQMESYGW